jgi:hypothetical protein
MRCAARRLAWTTAVDPKPDMLRQPAAFCVGACETPVTCRSFSKDVSRSFVAVRPAELEKSELLSAREN